MNIEVANFQRCECVFTCPITKSVHVSSIICKSLVSRLTLLDLQKLGLWTSSQNRTLSYVGDLLYIVYILYTHRHIYYNCICVIICICISLHIYLYIYTYIYTYIYIYIYIYMHTHTHTHTYIYNLQQHYFFLSLDASFIIIFKYCWFTILCYFQVYATITLQILFLYRLLQKITIYMIWMSLITCLI